jgi:subtilisin family serine protease
MYKRPTHNSLSVACESLEPRRLLAWGAFPQLIDQDVAASAYSQYNGSGQTIAFIDTGNNYPNPILSNRYLGGYDYIDNDSNPIDEDGHGSAVATLALGGAYTFNGADYRGVATGAKAISLRVDDGGTIPDSRYEAALRWIINNRTTYNITVVNASFGDGHYSTEGQRAVYADELATLADAGVYIIASSGNDGAQSPYGIEYPAADPNVFAAGSINSSDVISKFTERGAIMDLLAPGENVPTLYTTTTAADIIQASGTSFSAPIVAGAAAILKQIDPTFTPWDINSILRASGSDNWDGDKEATPRTNLIYPRLDLDNAIALALARRRGQATAANIGNNGRENAVRTDRDDVLHYAWYDGSDHRLKYSVQNANGIWAGVQTIDSGADVGHFLSMALTSSGKPAVAYYDAYNADLKYAHFNGSKWVVETVDARKTTGYYPSLGFDRFDHPVITYYYRTGGDLRVASNTGSGWSIAAIDTSGDSGRYSSFAISNSGQWTVAYENTTTGQFRFARQNGSSWSTQTVDATTRGGGGFISLAYTPSNQPAMSYYDAYNADLKFAQYNGSAWATTTVAAKFSQGLYSNLYVNASGNADIFYFHKTSDAVFRATGRIGNWSVNQIASGGGRHVFTTRYSDGTGAFAYYESASADLRVDYF